MSDDGLSIDDGTMTPEQEQLAATLSPVELEKIDEALLENVTKRWRKIARIVGTTMVQLDERTDIDTRVRDLPDVFFARRVVNLANSGALEWQGYLGAMGFSQVRLAGGRRSGKA